MRPVRVAIGALFASTMFSAGALAGGDYFVSAKVADVLGSPDGSLRVLEDRIVIPADLQAPRTQPSALYEDPDDPTKRYAIFALRTERPDPQPVAGRSMAELGVTFEVVDNPVVEASAVLSFNDIISFGQDVTDGLAVQLALSTPIHGVISGLGLGDTVSGRVFQRITPQDAVDVGRTIQFQQRFFEARYFDDGGQPGVRVCNASTLAALDLLFQFGGCDDDGEFVASLGSSSTYLGDEFLFELGFEMQLMCDDACDPGVSVDFDETFAPSFRAGPFQAELPIFSASGLFGALVNGSDDVPEPESLALLALALLGLGAARRRRAA